jgi:uncharacterized membrane protein YdcZ (DUF606 family)
MGRFYKKYYRARPGRNYIFLVVSPAVAGAPVPVAASAGAALIDEVESVVMVEDDSVVAGVVVLVSLVAVFDSHEVRPTAMKRAAADTFRRLFILR